MNNGVSRETLAGTNMTFVKLLYSLDLVPYIRRDIRRVDRKTIFCISN